MTLALGDGGASRDAGLPSNTAYGAWQLLTTAPEASARVTVKERQYTLRNAADSALACCLEGIDDAPPGQARPDDARFLREVIKAGLHVGEPLAAYHALPDSPVEVWSGGIRIHRATVQDDLEDIKRRSGVVRQLVASVGEQSAASMWETWAGWPAERQQLCADALTALKKQAKDRSDIGAVWHHLEDHVTDADFGERSAALLRLGKKVGYDLATSIFEKLDGPGSHAERVDLFLTASALMGPGSSPQFALPLYAELKDKGLDDVTRDGLRQLARRLDKAPQHVTDLQDLARASPPRGEAVRSLLQLAEAHDGLAPAWTLWRQVRDEFDTDRLNHISELATMVTPDRTMEVWSDLKALPSAQRGRILKAMNEVGQRHSHAEVLALWSRLAPQLQEPDFASRCEAMVKLHQALPAEKADSVWQRLDTSTREDAVHVASQLKSPALWALVDASLGSPEFRARGDALATLKTEFGSQAAVAMWDAFNAHPAPLPVKASLLASLHQMRGSAVPADVAMQDMAALCSAGADIDTAQHFSTMAKHVVPWNLPRNWRAVRSDTGYRILMADAHSEPLVTPSICLKGIRGAVLEIPVEEQDGFSVQVSTDDGKKWSSDTDLPKQGVLKLDLGACADQTIRLRFRDEPEVRKGFKGAFGNGSMELHPMRVVGKDASGLRIEVPFDTLVQGRPDSVLQAACQGEVAIEQRNRMLGHVAIGAAELGNLAGAYRIFDTLQGSVGQPQFGDWMEELCRLAACGGVEGTIELWPSLQAATVEETTQALYIMTGLAGVVPDLPTARGVWQAAQPYRNQPDFEDRTAALAALASRLGLPGMALVWPRLESGTGPAEDRVELFNIAHALTGRENQDVKVTADVLHRALGLYEIVRETPLDEPVREAMLPLSKLVRSAPQARQDMLARQLLLVAAEATSSSTERCDNLRFLASLKGEEVLQILGFINDHQADFADRNQSLAHILNRLSVELMLRDAKGGRPKVADALPRLLLDEGRRQVDHVVQHDDEGLFIGGVRLDINQQS